MNRKSVFIFMLFAFFIASERISSANQDSNEQTDLFEMSLEELMKVPVIYSSSQRLQPITEAASNVEIVTAEDIRRSGAKNLSDVLRSVAGVQVRETSSSSHVIGVRGFVDGQHVLVTLNGNSTYLNCMNVTYFDIIPVSLEEIERIEIIKGPGGLFYGASAFSGVINIITRNPKQLEGTQISMYAGNQHTSGSNLLHGGSWKNWEYSAGGGFNETDYLTPSRLASDNEDTLSSYGFVNIIRKLNDDAAISMDIRQSYSDDGIFRNAENARNTYLTLRYDKPDFWMRGFYNRQTKSISNRAMFADTITNEYEIMRTFKWGKNITSVGGFAKHVNLMFKSNVTGSKVDNNIENFAVKIENEYHATDKLILNIGGRADYYSEIDWVGLGRGSVIYKLNDNKRVAATLSRGYYLPSIVQLYGYGAIAPLPYNKSLGEEKITSFELSYYSQLSKRIKFKSAFFYNDYKGLIPYTAGATPTNSVDAFQHGLETDFDFVFTDWLSGFANYTYQTMNRSNYSSLEINPEHMINFGLNVESGKWSTNLTCHYVDRFYELFDVANPPVAGSLASPQKIDSYFTTDARIAYQANENLEFSVSATNLFNERHYESNKTGGGFNSDIVERRIIAGFLCRF